MHKFVLWSVTHTLPPPFLPFRLDRDEQDNFKQQHDMDLAKDFVRGDVENEVRQLVDRLIVVQMENIARNQKQKQLAAGGKGKKKKVCVYTFRAQWNS